jgi:hypothetical protein
MMFRKACGIHVLENKNFSPHSLATFSIQYHDLKSVQYVLKYLDGHMDVKMGCTPHN